MGHPVEINTMLKLKPEQGLDEENLQIGAEYRFEKSDERIYPLRVPLLLANQDWEIIGTVEVIEFTQGFGQTSGRYRVVDIFDDNFRAQMTAKFAKK